MKIIQQIFIKRWKPILEEYEKIQVKQGDGSLFYNTLLFLDYSIVTKCFFNYRPLNTAHKCLKFIVLGNIISRKVIFKKEYKSFESMIKANYPKGLDAK